MDTCAVVQETPTDILYTPGISEYGNTRKIHQCDICHSGFERRSNLKAHYMTHTGEKPHKCPHCAMSFSRKYNMQSHILIHTGEKPYKCTCGISFTRKKYLNVHIEYQEKKTTKVGVEVHRQVVTPVMEFPTREVPSQLQKPEKPFRCMICFKTFTRKNNLKQHMIGHTDSKPFKCTECHKTFTKNANLKSHMSTHSGERPHVCLICQLCFSRKSNLTKHTLTHRKEKQHTCTECGMTFSQKKNLNSHTLIHTGTSPYKCQNCGKCFARKDSLVRHMNTYVTNKGTDKRKVSCFVGQNKYEVQRQVTREVETQQGDQVCSLFQPVEQREGSSEIDNKGNEVPVIENDTKIINLPAIPVLLHEIKQVPVFIQTFNTE